MRIDQTKPLLTVKNKILSNLFKEKYGLKLAIQLGLKGLMAVTLLQGIIGADGRHYILDLFRTFPPDANFLGGTLVKAFSTALRNYFIQL